MTEPTFNKDGYPTDETLEAIEKWDAKDIPGLFAFMEEAWCFSHYWNRDGDILSISTGGWSGNESIISAFQVNYIAWMFTWVSSRRGGHYEFEVREKK